MFFFLILNEAKYTDDEYRRCQQPTEASEAVCPFLLLNEMTHAQSVCAFK